MERSDELLNKALLEDRGLTRSERGELREAYLYEQTQKQARSVTLDKRTVGSNEDMLNLPRHKVDHTCADFEECPVCFKCRNFNSSYQKCVNCVLNKEKLICKTELHTPKVFNMVIKRNRVDLDEKTMD